MPIICATDFSPCSRAAARVAAGVARRRGERLVLVHVNPPEPANLAMMAAMVEGMLEELRATVAVDLASEASEIARPDSPVETRLLAGLPAEGLIDLSHAADTSLLVMGTYGRGRGERILIGSCSEKVAREAGCPVLVVPERAARLEAWQSEAPLRVLLGTDGSPATEALFHWARTAAPAAAPDLPIVRLYWPPQDGVRYGPDHPWHQNSGSPELLALLERDVRRDAAALAGGRDLDVHLQVLGKNGGEDLAETARGMNVNAVAVGVPRHRFRHWTPIDIKALLRCAALPVFCIPEALHPAERRIPHYRTVLIASDLSDVAREAILPAYGLLAGGGRVELCHVHPTADAPMIDHSDTTPPLTDAQRAALLARLEREVPAEAAEHGIATHVSVLEGRSIPTAILQAAERIDADAIALASHGRTGVGRWLLGSVAEEVARRSSRPVLLIHAKPGDGPP
jgi:nucleotide-binding universal stress UspA family protein